jgi:uncharacterized membrane protein YeaQ/YmgE (transglycosylase-associated protein family)
MNDFAKISFASEPMNAALLWQSEFLAKWDEIVDDSSQMDTMINCLLTITGARHAGSSHRVIDVVDPTAKLVIFEAVCGAFVRVHSSALECRLMWKRFAAVIRRSGRARFC